MTAGRPTTFNEEIASRICERLADGESIRQMCRDDDMPGQKTIYQWLQRHPEFTQQYAKARELQLERWAEEVVEIADDGSNDWMERENKDGTTYVVGDHEHINRSRLRVDTRKWLMSKLAPKKYGDRVMQEHTGADGGPIAIQQIERIIIRPKDSDGGGVRSATEPSKI